MELHFDGMSSDDEETLPKISFGSFTSTQECKREPGATGPTSTGSPPTDPRLVSKIGKRQGYRPSPRTQLNGDKNGSRSGAAIGDHPRGSTSVGGPVGGPIRKRRSRSARARNPVYNVKFEIRSKTVKNFLGTSSDAADESADEDDFDEDTQQQHGHEQNGGSRTDA